MIEFEHQEKWPTDVIVYTDGASRGNPGLAAIGVSVLGSDLNAVYEWGEALGIQTNNFAEYTAVKLALQACLDHGVKKVTVRSDSEFLVKQMRGEYKVKSETIRPLYLACVELKNKLGSVQFEHVRREMNKRADELANLALDS